jgi:hypothetical protein
LLSAQLLLILREVVVGDDLAAIHSGRRFDCPQVGDEDVIGSRRDPERAPPLHRLFDLFPALARREREIGRYRQLPPSPMLAGGKCVKDRLATLRLDGRHRVGVEAVGDRAQRVATGVLALNAANRRFGEC